MAREQGEPELYSEGHQCFTPRENPSLGELHPRHARERRHSKKTQRERPAPEEENSGLLRGRSNRPTAAVRLRARGLPPPAD